MKKFITSFLLLIFLSNSFGALASNAGTIWADDSINDDIVKKYNTNAISEEFLPALPDSLKQETKNTESKPTEPTQTNTQQKEPEIIKAPPIVQNNYTSGKSATLKWGTKFKLRVESAIDDSLPVGADIYFTSLYPETNKYITIPAGTKFIGRVEDAHLPQISSNGGLLVIKIDRLVYNGNTYPIEAKVIKVGNKKIFLNNIKGQHTYIKNLTKAAKPSINFYKKSWRITKKFAQDGLEVILTPITFTSGVVVLAVGTAASPVVAFFSKGGRLFINKGTNFQIKLIKDASINI